MITWNARHPRFQPDMLGYVLDFLDEDDPRPAQQQFDANYRFGAGWTTGKFTIAAINDALCYPGDPPQPPLAECQLRHERVLFYPHELIAIVQPDGSFVVQRMD